MEQPSCCRKVSAILQLSLKNIEEIPGERGHIEGPDPAEAAPLCEGGTGGALQQPYKRQMHVKRHTTIYEDRRSSVCKTHHTFVPMQPHSTVI